MKTRGRPRHPDVLTLRQWEVLTLVREGLTNPQIAERLGITMDAAKSHVSEILSRLELSSREEAAAWRPEPPPAPVMRPSWANALGHWWPSFARIAGAGAMVAAVAGLGVIAYGVINSEGAEEPTVGAAPSATAAPALDSAGAEQIVAEGNLASFAATESGAVFTVWRTCESRDDTDCAAWRLGTGAQTQATGIAGHGNADIAAYASGDVFVFVIVSPFDDSGGWSLIAQDGTASPLTACRDATWSTPTEPGRMFAGHDKFVDTAAGTICDARRIGLEPDDGDAVFTAEGTLWTLVNNEPDPDTLTIGRYDGAQWRYYDLASQAATWTSVLAAADSSVAVLQGTDPTNEDGELVRAGQFLGLAVTTDDGATWSQVLAQELPFATFVPESPVFALYTSMAFAGESTLYVADGHGYLWRSTDFATFDRVLVPFDVSDLRSAGQAVIARVDDGTCSFPVECQLNDLVRISADGTWEPIIAR
jgi:DNA-binding CsgD family transcriptional regulator